MHGLSDDQKVLLAMASLAKDAGYDGHGLGPLAHAHWDELETETGLSRSEIAPILVSLKDLGLVTAPIETSDTGAHKGQAFINANGLRYARDFERETRAIHISEGSASERFRVIGTLVDAYLEDASEFHIVWVLGAPAPELLHPKLKDPVYLPWSHIDALAREGIIYLSDRGGNELITIPTWVLQSYEMNAGAAVSLPQGPARVDALARSQVTYLMTTNNTNIHGGQVNLAQQSHDFSQAASRVENPQDIESVINTLRGTVLTDLGAEQLRVALLEDEETSGSRTIGQKVSAFLARISTDASGELLAVGVLQALPLISTALQAYAG